MTLTESGQDGTMWMLGAMWQVTENFSLHMNQGFLRDNLENSGKEIDIVLHYDYHDSLSFDAIYSTLDNQKVSGDKFDSVRVFANYNF